MFKNSSEARTIDLTEQSDDFSYIDLQYFKGNIANSLFTILLLKDWFLFAGEKLPSKSIEVKFWIAEDNKDDLNFIDQQFFGEDVEKFPS